MIIWHVLLNIKNKNLLKNLNKGKPKRQKIWLSSVNQDSLWDIYAKEGHDNELSDELYVGYDYE